MVLSRAWKRANRVHSRIFGSLLLVIFTVFAVSAGLSQPAFADHDATECDNNSAPGSTFPRSNTGAQESNSCAGSDTWLWLSDYHSGSPLNTPRSNLRIFYRDSSIAGLPNNFDTISFSTSWTRVRCGSDVTITYSPTGATTPFRKDFVSGVGCFNVAPGTFTVNKSHLSKNASRYGNDVSYIDITLFQNTDQSNAPARVHSSLGSARITFQEQSLAQAETTTTPANRAFALWSGDTATSRTTYSLRFAPDCTINIGATRTIYLKWYDADDGVPSTQPYIFEMVLINTTTNAEVLRLNSDSYVFGGNDEYGSVAVDIVGGNNYRWVWHGISRNNGIQVYMPFSEINATNYVNCDEPVTGNVAVSCATSTGTNNATIRVRKGSIDDPDNESMTLSATQGSTTRTGTFTNSTAATTNIVTFSVTRSSTDYSVSWTVTDSGGSTRSGTATVNCPPPTPPTVSITVSSCNSITYRISSSENFTFSSRLLVDGADSTYTQGSRVRDTDYNYTAVARWRDFGTHTFAVSISNSVTGTVTSSDVTVGPCLDLACGDASTDPAVVERNTTFRASVQFRIVVAGSITGATPQGTLTRMGQDGTAVTVTPSISFSGLAGFSGPTTALTNQTINRATGQTLNLTNIGLYTAPGTVGDYTLTYSLDGPTAQSDVTCGEPDNRVAAKPYFKVYESDVSIGDEFGTADGIIACAPGNTIGGASGNGYAFARNTPYSGASVEFALLATNELNGLYSGGLTNPSSYTNFTFANTAGTYGGNFGSAGRGCVANYWREAVGESFNSTNNYAINSASGSLSRVFVQPNGGNTAVRIRGSGNIRGRQAIYVNGDALIDANIISSSTTWSSPDEIPITYIIARGNIYIDPSVSQIDALLVALPEDANSDGVADNNTGAFFSCRATPSYSASNYPGYNACNNKLVINGAIVANEVHFGRTPGTLSQSAANEGPASANIAEVIYMSPEYFIGTPPQDPIPGSQFSTDSASVLPPVF